MLFQATINVTIIIDFEAPLIGFDVRKHVLPSIEERGLNAIGEFLKSGQFEPHDKIVSLNVQSDMKLHPSMPRHPAKNKNK